MSRYRLVIKSLKEPEGEATVKILGNLSQKDADTAQKRFMKLKWDLRRPGIYTIDHVALVVELDI